VGSGQSALDSLRKDPPPDLVLLDLMLPDLAGTEVCRRIRQDDRTRAVPVIMVTGKGDEIDRVVGFEVGADDYIVKPFSMRELLLRVRAVLRRRRPADPEAPTSAAMEFGVLRVDSERHRAWVNGAEVHLTPLEFRLIEVLLSRRGRVLTREMLLSEIWGLPDHTDSRTIDTHVRRLREALGPAAEYIETVRGVGYRVKEPLNGQERGE
jgi:two-component system phosphate regulon response regulator PhoB